MKKYQKWMLYSALAGMLAVSAGCGEKENPIPKGIYESEKIHGYTVQMVIKDEWQFVEYIDSRPVQEGTYQEDEEGYLFLGDQTEFAVQLSENGTLEFSISSIDRNQDLQLKKTGGDPKQFEEITEGISHYRTLLEE